MSNEVDYVANIKNGLPVPGPKILERRTKGLSAIRQHFVARLMRSTGMRLASSLVVRWRQLGERANSRVPLDESFELLLRGGVDPITGMFPDLWVLCYPEDAEIKQKVEAEMDRMCGEAAQRLGIATGE